MRAVILTDLAPGISRKSQGFVKVREMSRNFYRGRGKYLTLDCLCEEQGHQCTVTVFVRVKID